MTQEMCLEFLPSSLTSSLPRANLFAKASPIDVTAVCFLVYLFLTFFVPVFVCLFVCLFVYLVGWIIILSLTGLQSYHGKHC